MFKLGLTGSIATGKSTAVKMFNALGYLSFSADDVVHLLYENEAVPLIRKHWPEAVINNIVNRATLSALLLKDPQQLEKLEILIHPLVKQKYIEFVEQANSSNEKLVILDIPLLFESKNKYDTDAIAVTFCAPDLQKQRALSRKNMSEEKFAMILEKQIPQEIKKQRADFLIDSNKSLPDMEKQIVEIANQCLQRT